jgi:hypothetical protein
MMKIINKFMSLILIAALFVGVAFAGDVDRTGTTAGVQVQIPVGGRSLAMGGSDIAYTSGVDAIFWNPAGLSDVKGRVDGMFSSAKIIADISTNYFALAFNTGSNGVLAVSMKSLAMGDIAVTTVHDMDGTGATFSPTFSVLGASYARELTDRISIGLNAKLIYESIPRASGTALAFDFGLQYKNLMDVEGLGLGIAIRNIGTNMEYGGTAMLLSAREEDETYDDFFNVLTSSDQLPASMEMGLTYKPTDMILVSAVYQNSNAETDYLKVGTELNFAGIGFVRAGYAFQLNAADADLGYSVYGLTLGAGVKFDVSTTKISVDYVFRPGQFLGTENLICLGIGL